MKSDRSGAFIPAFTGLRIVAACLVFFYHSPIPVKRVGLFLSDFCRELYIGVSIFFVLSGFLIALRYADDFKYNSSYFLTYLKNRFARIYPMYFILTSLTFILYTRYPFIFTDSFNSFTKDHLTKYLLNITLLKAFFNDLKYSGIAQGWTLTVEECFYFCAPFIFLIRKKISLLTQILFLFATGFLLVLLSKDIDYYGLFENNKFMLISTFFGRCFEFYVGIQLAIWYKKDKTIMSRKSGYYTYAGILSIIGVVLLLMLTRDEKAEYYHGINSSIGLPINNFVLPLAIALFFKGLLQEQTVIKRILENKFVVLLGKSSYVFYLIHMGFIPDILYYYVTHNYLLNFPLLLLISVIIYKTVEAPLNSYIRNFSFKTAT